jgi:uncharacterized protein (DUF2147 family)
MKKTLTLLLALQLLGAATASAAGLDSPVGLWEAFDAKTGKATGRMRVYQEGNAFFGRNEALSPTDRAGERCTRCTDDRKDQPLIGLIIMRNMHAEKSEYTGGDILDPSTGKVYSCKFHLSEDGKQLALRGFLGISLLGGTQMWRRIG